MFFQAVSAFFGGLVLLISPSGTLMHFPPEAIQKTPFPNYLIPGLALFLLLGVYPAVVFFGLLRRPRWKWAEALNVHKEVHWSLTHAIYAGIMLIFWIDIEVIWFSYAGLQTVYALIGLAMVILALTPGARRFYLLR